MVNRNSDNRFAPLCAKPSMFVRALGLAAALTPAIYAVGCQAIENDETATAEQLNEADRGVVLSAVAISEQAIRFQTGDEAVELALIPNAGLLAPDAVVVRDGVKMTPAEAGIALPYRGYVVGDPDSWIRVSVSERGFEGLVYMRDELWDVRESGEGEIIMAPADVADYVDIPSHLQHSCATADAEAAHATYADELTTGAMEAKGCMQISIALVADYSHVAKLGGASASENEMVKRLNETDGIYRAQLNYGFSVKQVRTFANSGGPSFNNKSSGNTPLDEFADYKKKEFAELGLAHLFLGRTSSGTVGRAFIGATCSTSKGAGVSNYLGKGKASTVVVAHEIGHNFGAPHDASNAPYIMAPSIEDDSNKFSNGSKSKIHSHVGSVSCFKPCDADQPDPKPDPKPEPEGGSCDGACGGKSTDGCYCDAQCSKYGDCCDDYPQVCPNYNDNNGKNSCAGSCGGKSPDGCWCDAQCSKHGDCCVDKQQVCG